MCSSGSLNTFVQTYSYHQLCACVSRGKEERGRRRGEGRGEGREEGRERGGRRRREGRTHHSPMEVRV